jgi:hypothetical protein
VKSIRIAMIAWGVVVTVGTAQGPMREGRWEVTMQMRMPGMAMPALTSVQCVTSEQLEDPVKSLPTTSPGCTMSDYKTDGGTVTWKMACEDMAGTGEIIFSGDTYEGQLTITSPKQISVKMSGERLGDCVY